MRRILYVLMIALSFFAPVKRLDIAKLLPVEAVAVCRIDDKVKLITDLENTGFGADVMEALADLKNSTAAVVYLDTAEFLMVGEGADNDAAQLLPYLKKSIVIGAYNGGDVRKEARYLDVHGQAEKPQ